MQTDVMDASMRNWKKILNTPYFDGHLDENNPIGRGRFGQVFRYEDSNGSFALKRISLPMALNDYKTPPADIENIELLFSIKHRNIVPLMRVERGRSQIYFYLELMDGGNLKELINSRLSRGKALSESAVKSFTAQILLGLQYLHVRKIVHRDLKPENVMLSGRQNRVKITDFSLSRLISTTAGSLTHSAKGTWHYMAPEVVRCENYSVKCDIWSLGATVVEMLCGSPPFANIRNEATLVLEISQLGKSKWKPDYDLPGERRLADSTADLLDQIFQPYPAQRPSASALLASEYFSCVDLDDEDSDSDSEDEYSLNGNRKGRMLVISNIKYDEPWQRPSGKVDATRLNDTFEGIGFTTVVKKDLKAFEMLNSIETFASDSANKDYSCLLIALSAHGNDKGISGLDGRVVSLKQIIDLLSSENALNLIGKPKILIIQSCRGINAPAVFTPVGATSKSEAAGASSPEEEDNSNIIAAFESDDKPSKSGSGARVGALDQDSAILNYAASKSDILVAYSSSKGDKAFRKAYDGSIFIEILCKMVQKDWRKMTLLDILSVVTGKVGTTVFNSFKGTVTQIPLIKSTLRRKFYLSHFSERVSPTSGSSFGACNGKKAVKEILVLAGGFNSSSTFVYNAVANKWSRATELAVQRYRAAAALWNNKVVVAGGWNTADKYLNSTEQFDPETNEWSNFQPMLYCRRGLALVTFDKKLFAIGGRDSDEPLSSVEKYDRQEEEWSFAPTLNEPRDYTCAAISESIILVCGGSDGKHWLDSCEYLDKAAAKWTYAASLGTARSSASLASLNDKFYIFGGYNDESKILDSAEEYNHDARQWTVLPVRLSKPRYQSAAACSNERIYVCGGEGGNHAVECFDSTNVTLTNIAPLLQGLRGAVAVSCPVTSKALKYLFK